MISNFLYISMLWLLSSTVSLAQQFVEPFVPLVGEIDYPGLFETYADEVEENGNSRRVLKLGSIVITEYQWGSGHSYSGIDNSEGGAVGCFLALVLEISVFVDRCSDVGSLEQLENLDIVINRLADFYSRNGFPAQDARDFRADVSAYRQSFVNDVNGQTSVCRDDDEFSGGIAFADNLMGDEAIGKLDAIFEEDRLPVSGLCFGK